MPRYALFLESHVVGFIYYNGDFVVFHYDNFRYKHVSKTH